MIDSNRNTVRKNVLYIRLFTHWKTKIFTTRILNHAGTNLLLRSILMFSSLIIYLCLSRNLGYSLFQIKILYCIGFSWWKCAPLCVFRSYCGTQPKRTQNVFKIHNNCKEYGVRLLGCNQINKKIKTRTGFHQSKIWKGTINLWKILARQFSINNKDIKMVTRKSHRAKRPHSCFDWYYAISLLVIFYILFIFFFA